MKVRRHLPPAHFVAALATALPAAIYARRRREPRRAGWGVRLERDVAALRRDWEGLGRGPAPELACVRHELNPHAPDPEVLRAINR